MGPAQRGRDGRRLDRLRTHHRHGRRRRRRRGADDLSALRPHHQLVALQRRPNPAIHRLSRARRRCGHRRSRHQLRCRTLTVALHRPRNVRLQCRGLDRAPRPARPIRTPGRSFRRGIARYEPTPAEPFTERGVPDVVRIVRLGGRDRGLLGADPDDDLRRRRTRHRHGPHRCVRSM